MYFQCNWGVTKLHRPCPVWKCIQKFIQSFYEDLAVWVRQYVIVGTHLETFFYTFIHWGKFHWEEASLLKECPNQICTVTHIQYSTTNPNPNPLSSSTEMVSGWEHCSSGGGFSLSSPGFIIPVQGLNQQPNSLL